MTKLFHLLFCVFLTSQFAFLTAQAGDEKVKPSPETYTDATGSLAFAGYDRAPAHPVVGQNGMVAAQERIAAQVGRDILAKGGNAVDAAVAMGFALAVTHPSAGNLGGGGFMMIALPDTNKVIALDFREMAPRGASRDMYLDAHGNVDKSKAQFSRLSAGIPGTVAGLLEALETYGTMNRKQVMAPAIRLADKGFPVSYGLSHSLKSVKKYLAKDPSSIKYFYKPDGSPYAQGEMFRQKDLAKTLKRIARYGAKEFYEGKTARLLADEMKRGGGLITLEDMNASHTDPRTPVHGT
ncbi:MAG TPA: hypothetical protein ENK01_04510 [Hellea balneolensis]|uniref:Gamma-glutamyltransferase n=1 Tax=Hellea balneolensis TaxID=287478 RepID=A0A7V5NXP8_9PROT|nr:hypothetical protein [Hellea balneolensis]